MVSFWPFGGNDTSAAGFEKVLSSLTERINKTSAKDARLRSQQRRVRVLWTLYTGLPYLIVLLILVFVVGWRDLTPTQYAGLTAGPIGIFIGRLVIDTVYRYRITVTSTYLDDLVKQRSEAIEKLKAATKYNSTQQLLDRYAAPAPKPEQSSKKSPAGKRSASTTPKTTGIAPPPTANIPNRPTSPPGPAPPPDQAPPATPPHPTAEFAPNAFPAPAHHPRGQDDAEYATPAPPSAATRWFDALLEAVMGEDETRPRNRIALICGSCRLVNGQAPPGTRGLEDLGSWRCMGCGAMNGVEGPAERAVKEARVVEAAGGEAGSGDEDVSMHDVGDEVREGGKSTGAEKASAARQRKGASRK